MAALVVDIAPPARAAAPGVPPESPASPGRRLAAFSLDLAVLLAAYACATTFGLAITDADVVVEVLLLWLCIVSPLYFALYHAFGGPEGGPGATPGEGELRLCVRDAASGERLPLRTALLRAYGGLAAGLLVLPLLADLASLLVREPHRTAWHDRVFRSIVVYRPPTAAADLPPSDPSAASAFVGGGSVWARATRLRGVAFRPTLAVYVGLVLIATLLIPLVVTDFASDSALDELAGWAMLSVLIFLSGVFWAQSVIVAQIEAVRTGARPSIGTTLRRAAEQANALTVALLLLAPMILLAPYTLFVILWPVARLGFVVPVIVIERTPVLAAFGRSWRLTSGHDGRALGLLLGGGTAVVATIVIALATAFSLLAALAGDAGLAAYAVAAATALLAAAVPVSAVIARVGAAWCLFYYDRRLAAEAR